MNIKEAQARSGISPENIRFYEKQGLLSPARNKDNDYREYSEADILTLKHIRVLRMVDLPLSLVKAVLDGEMTLRDAALQQQKRLEERSSQLQAAIGLCREMSALSRLEDLDEDGLLAQADDPAQQDGFFQNWVDDYRRVALAEHEKRFTFLPDEAVTNPREFTAALLSYAAEHGLDIVMIRESMSPQFTLNGVAYTATRNYTAVRGCPVVSIACEVLHPEALDAPDVPPRRRKLQRALHYVWLPVLLALFVILPRKELFASPEGWLALVTFLILAAALSIRGWLLFGNENGKRGK